MAAKASKSSQNAAKSSFGSLHNEAYKRFVELLVKRREATDLKQWQIAQKLGWNQSVIAKIEGGNRRIDLLEMVMMAEAVGYDAVALVPEAQTILREEGYLPLKTDAQADSTLPKPD